MASLVRSSRVNARSLRVIARSFGGARGAELPQIDGTFARTHTHKRLVEVSW